MGHEWLALVNIQLPGTFVVTVFDAFWLKKYSLVTTRKRLPLNYSKPQHQWYKPHGLRLAGWKSELFSLSNLFFTAVMLFLSSFNATMHINYLLPSHKLTTFIIIIACYSKVSHMFDAISLFCSLSSKCIFVSQLLPSATLLPGIWIKFLVTPAIWPQGGRAAFIFSAYSLPLSSHRVARVGLLNIFWARGLSVLENSIFI